MDFQDPPRPNAVQIRYSSDFRQDGERLLLAADKPTSKKTLRPEEIPSAGGVSLKQLPKGWKSAEPKFNYSGTAKMFTPPNDDTCAIILVYENLRERYREPLKRLLQSPAHTLTEKELEDIGGLILYSKGSDEFRLAKAQTKDIAGKRVLLVDGYNTALNRRFYFIYWADAAVNFETYTKIWFVAEPEAMGRYKKEALDSIYSLQF